MNVRVQALFRQCIDQHLQFFRCLHTNHVCTLKGSIIVRSEERKFITQEKTLSIERSTLRELLISQLKKKNRGNW